VRHANVPSMKIAVREIDQLDDPVDQGVAEGNERDERAIGDADHHGRQEEVYRAPSLTRTGRETGSLRLPPDSVTTRGWLLGCELLDE